MEPIDLNSDEAIENALRTSRPAPLADNGFSTRVLATLSKPNAKKRGAFWATWNLVSLSLWAAGLAGFLVVIRGSSVDQQISPVISSLTSMLSGAWSSLGIATAVLACLYPFLNDDEKSRD